MDNQKRQTILILIFCWIQACLFSQDRDIIDKLDDRFFLRNLTHHIWRPEFSADTLQKGDTLTVWTRCGDRRIAKSFGTDHTKYQSGEIKFLRNHKIKRLGIFDYKSKPRKNDWKQIGTWKFDKYKLFLFFDKKTYEVEWVENTGDFVKGTIIDIKIDK